MHDQKARPFPAAAIVAVAMGLGGCAVDRQATLIVDAAGVGVQGLWLRVPNAAELYAVYPLRAQQLAVGGRVELYCRVNARGDLNACIVNSEIPMGYGLGEAALGLSDKFQINMRAPRAPAAGEFVSVPIRWTVE